MCLTKQFKQVILQLILYLVKSKEIILIYFISEGTFSDSITPMAVLRFLEEIIASTGIVYLPLMSSFTLINAFDIVHFYNKVTWGKNLI